MNNNSELDEYGVWVKNNNEEAVAGGNSSEEDSLPDFSFLDKVAASGAAQSESSTEDVTAQTEEVSDNFDIESADIPDTSDTAGESVTEEAESGEQEIDLDSFMDGGFDEPEAESTPNTSTEEISLDDFGMGSGGDEEISLDDFIDGGFETAPAEESSETVEDQEALDIDLKFDEGDSPAFEEESVDDNADLDSLIGRDFSTPETEEENHEAVAGEEIDLSDFGFTDEEASTKVDVPAEETPKKEEPVEYEMNVSLDDTEESSVSSTAVTSDEGSEDISIETTVEEEKDDVSSGSGVTFGAPDDSFDIDSILGDVDFDDDGKNDVSDQSSPAEVGGDAGFQDSAETQEEAQSVSGESHDGMEETSEKAQENASDSEIEEPLSQTEEADFSFDTDEETAADETEIEVPVSDENSSGIDLPDFDDISLSDTDIFDDGKTEEVSFGDETSASGDVEEFSFDDNTVNTSAPENIEEVTFGDNETASSDSDVEEVSFGNDDADVQDEPDSSLDSAFAVSEENSVNDSDDNDDLVTADDDELITTDEQADEIPLEASFMDIGETSGDEVPDTFDEEAASLEKEPSEEMNTQSDEKEVYSVFAKESSGEFNEPQSDFASAGDELVTAGSSSAAGNGDSDTQEILQDISNQIASLKSEINSLKSEFEVLKNSRPSADDDFELPKADDTNDSGGFFSDSDEDDTIALSGDELNNILNTAELTPQEHVPSYSEEESAPAVDDILVESSSSDLMDTPVSTDNMVPSETSEEPALTEEAPAPSIDSLSKPIDLFNEEQTSQALTEENIDFLRETENAGEAEKDEVLEKGISEEPVEEVFEKWENSSEASGDTVTSEPVLDETPASDETAVSDEDVASDEMVTVSEETASAADEPDDDELITVSGDEPSVPDETAVTETKDTSDSGISADMKDEIKSVLAYMDQLLESLPEEKIAEFAQSEQFETYKKLFKELGLA
ncbi:MAG: hypothetical protein J5780_05385 [Treponema sp.]|nr:hypothetical protein [Treponema sp.]